MSAPSPVSLLGVVAVASLACFPAAVSAQDRDVAITPPTVEIGGGIGWVGQADAGTRDATMTANAPGEAEAITFFSASGKTRSGPVGVGTVGLNFSRRFGVEAGLRGPAVSHAARTPRS